MSILEMSVSGAMMILAIVMIRALAMNRLPKKTFLALWGITLVRLLIPYSLPSALSVYSLLSGLSSPAKTGLMRNGGMAVQPDIVPMTGIGGVLPVSGTTNTLPIVKPYVLVWLVGVLACSLFFAAVYRKCHREFREALPVDNGFALNWLKEHPLRRTIQLRQSDRISSPMTYGVFRPLILLPKHTDWGDETALAYVLAHEYVHIRHFDAATKLVLAATLCIHWFNPAVWVMYVLANRDLELNCDEAVIRLFGERTKSTYAMVLIRMEETRSGLRPFCNNFSKHAIQERIIAIMKTKKITWLATFAALLLVVCVTTAFATNGQAAKDSNDTSAWNGVAWWTAEEYKAWLEQEKVNLQSVIGSQGWTPSTGWFIWTQEMVDETIAQYEQTLKGIENGLMVSKAVYDQTGNGTQIIMSYTFDDLAQSADYAEDDLFFTDNTHEPTQNELLDEYGNFGISFDTSGKMLYQGKLVRWFADFVELEEGAFATRYVYRNDEGTAYIHTVRDRIDNGDGSYDLFGSLLGIVPWEAGERDDFGFLFQGNQSVQATTAIGSEDSTGTTFEERFARYKNFGITYVEARGASRHGNVYLNGQLVSHFVDIAPNGDTFSFDSADHGGIHAYTDYDNNGNLIGVQEMMPDAIAADEQARQYMREESQQAFEQTIEALAPYLPFGLDCQMDFDTGRLTMTWESKSVRRFYDAKRGFFVANSLGDGVLDTEAIDLEAVYDDGNLTGLKIAEK